jgi:hypothetical protein
MTLCTFLRVTEKGAVCAETICFKIDMDCGSSLVKMDGKVRKSLK